MVEQLPRDLPEALDPLGVGEQAAIANHRVVDQPRLATARLPMVQIRDDQLIGWIEIVS